jgi:tRNA pseudouridine32 synthase/23S rRNA pseudouridine746 synthase
MKSRLYLPKIASPPQTILDYLIAHFPHVAADAWRDRMARGQIAIDEEIDEGIALHADSPYRHGVTVLYSREAAEEPPASVSETILYRDEHILIADKPHGMVVTPSGDCVERSLLVRLQRHTGENGLAPVHRLDRETAGVVLFAIHTGVRAQYHRLFAERTIEREYEAVAKLNNDSAEIEWRVENRLEQGAPWYRRRIADASEGRNRGPNAATRIERLESRDGWGLFRLRPETGKKHQLRVHMASLGFPIAGDLLYPEIRNARHGDPPLQLLACRLAFNDPLSGEPRSFKSAQTLLWPR